MANLPKWTRWTRPETLLLAALVAGLLLAGVFALQPPIDARSGATVVPHLSESATEMGVDWDDAVSGPGFAVARTDRRLRRLTIAVLVLFAGVAGLGQMALHGVRAVSDRAELRLRRAVGAPRRRIIRSLRLEAAARFRDALILGCLLGLGAWGLAAVSWNPGDLAPEISGNPLVRATAIAAMLALIWTAFSFAVVTSGEALRGRPLHRTCPLGEPFRGEVCHPGVPILQIAFATAIVVSAGVLARTVIPPAEVVYALDPSMERLAARATAVDAPDLLREGVAALGRTEPVAITTPGFWESAGQVAYAETECGRCVIAGSPPVRAPYKGEFAVHHAVSPDTFDLAGIEVVAGRSFTWDDTREGDPVAVVSRGFALENFEGGGAIGRRVRLGDRGGTWHTVVGIIEPLPRESLYAQRLPPEDVIVPIGQVTPTEIELAGVSLDALLPLLPEAGLIASTPPEPIQDRWAALEAWTTWFRAVWTMFGWAALGLALVGVAATISRRVREVTPELALKRAVGATRVGLVREQLGVGLRMGIVGALLGGWAALFGVAAISHDGLARPAALAIELVGPMVAMVGVVAATAVVAAYAVTRKVVP